MKIHCKLMKNQNSFSIISARKYLPEMVRYSKQTFECQISNETDPNHVRLKFLEKLGETMHVISIQKYF